MPAAISVIGENSSAGGNNPFISRESLGPGLVGDLEKMGIDRGTALLSNTATSMFTKKNAAGDSAMSVASGAMGVAGAAVGGVGNIASGAALTVSQATESAAMIQELTAKCIETVISESTKSLTTYATKTALVIAKYPVDLVQRTGYWFATLYPERLKQLMKDENIDYEEVEEAYKEEQDKKTEEQDKKNLTEKLANMQTKVNEIMQAVEKPLQDISSYMNEGVGFVIDKSNKVVESTVNNVNKFCDKVYNDTKQWEETAADKKGYKMGDKKATNAAKQTVKAMRELLYQKQTAEKELKTKAKAQVKKAFLKLKGLMGA